MFQPGAGEGYNTSNNGGTPGLHRLMTAGLWVLGLVTVVGGAASVAGPPLRWWDRAPLAAVQERLAQGADLTVRNGYGQTPLHEAAESNADPAVVALLLDRGADINAPDLKGTTPLHWAAGKSSWRNPLPVVALLLDRGADPTLRDHQNRLPVELVGENSPLQGTDVYGRLQAAR